MFPGTFHLFRLLTFMSMRSPEASSGEQCRGSYNVSKCAALSYRLKSRASPELWRIWSECKWHYFVLVSPSSSSPAARTIPFFFFYCGATLTQFTFTPRPDRLALRLRSVCPCLGLGCPNSCTAKRIKGNKDFPGGALQTKGYEVFPRMPSKSMGPNANIFLFFKLRQPLSHCVVSV